MDDGGKPLDRRFEDASRSIRRRGAQVERVNRPRMADVSEERPTQHRAVASAELVVSQETLSAVIDGTNARGDVLSVAELAGVMAAKRVAEIIPLAHSSMLTELRVHAVPDRGAGAIRIEVEVAAHGFSGVEMEAMTGASVAALAAYDMVRDRDETALVRDVRLVSRTDEQGERQFGRPRSPTEHRVPPGARSAGRFVGSPRTGRPGQKRGS